MSFCEFHFLSKTLSQNVSCAVFLPENGPFGSDARPPYRQVIFLPGYSGDYTSIYTMLSIRRQAELKGLAVIIPNGCNSFYIDHPERNASWSSFVSKEIPERCRQTFCLSDKREDTYIAGISMGGYGALYNGLVHRDVFSKVAALSPAADPYILMGQAVETAGFGSEEFRNVFGTYEEYLRSPANLAAGYSSAKKEELPEIFVGCGDRDIAVGTQVEALDEAFHKAGIPYERFSCYGNHDIDTWEEMMDPVFSFLAGIEPGTRNSLRIPDELGQQDAIVK